MAPAGAIGRSSVMHFYSGPPMHFRSGVDIRSLALNILCANGVQNISLALYANAVSFDQLLALGAK